MAQVPSRVLAVWIDRDPAEIYDFASRPENFPLWASGLGSALRREGGRWIAETPDGAMEVRFSPVNPFGVLDHVVVTPEGEIMVPMRVLPNGTGAEVALTLLRQPGMSDARFEADAQWVARDLASLKRLLEAAAG